MLQGVRVALGVALEVRLDISSTFRLLQLITEGKWTEIEVDLLGAAKLNDCINYGDVHQKCMNYATCNLSLVLL